MNEEGAPSGAHCPFCAEQIKAAAKKCKHCGEFIDPAMRELELLKKHKQNVYMNAGGGGGGASASSVASALGGILGRMTCLDWVLTLCTGGLWLIVVALRGWL